MIFKKNFIKKHDDLPNTFIGDKCHITGDIDLLGPCIINGYVTGSIIHGTEELIIGIDAVIEANSIKCKRVIIHGDVNGNIIAEDIIITSKAVIKGNVSGKSINVDDGAIITGTVNIDNDFVMPTEDNTLPVYSKKKHITTSTNNDVENIDKTIPVMSKNKSGNIEMSEMIGADAKC